MAGHYGEKIVKNVFKEVETVKNTFINRVFTWTAKKTIVGGSRGGSKLVAKIVGGFTKDDNDVGAYGYIKTSDLLPNGEWKDDAVFVISDALPEIEVRPKKND